MFGTHPLGTHALGTSDGTVPPLPPAAALLTQAALDTVHLVEIHAYDLDAEAEAPIYVSDRGYITAPDDDPSNRVYAPRLDLPPYFERSIPVSTEDGFRVRLTIDEVGLSNADGAFDDAVKRDAIDGRRVIVRLGSPGFAFADIITLFDGTAAAWRRADDGTVRLDLRDVGYRVEKPIQQTLYEGSGGLEGTEELRGKPKPLVYGYARNVTATLVDPARQIYQLHDGAVQRVTAVYDAGLPLVYGGDVEDVERVTTLPRIAAQHDRGPAVQAGFGNVWRFLNVDVPAGLSDSLLVIEIAAYDPNPGDDEFQSVRWNSHALTRIARANAPIPGETSGVMVEFWSLVNPQPGEGDVVAKVSDSTSVAVALPTPQATVFTDVDTRIGWFSPTTATGAGTAASIQVATKCENSLAWAGFAQYEGRLGIQPGSGVNEQWEARNQDLIGWAGSRPAPTIGAYTINLITQPKAGSGLDWAMAAFEIPGTPKVPPGYFVTARAKGMVRLGDTPVGAVTAAVEGDATGNVFVAGTAQIAQRILSDWSDSEIKVDGASLVVLQTLQPAPVGIAITDEIPDGRRHPRRADGRHRGMVGAGQARPDPVRPPRRAQRHGSRNAEADGYPRSGNACHAGFGGPAALAPARHLGPQLDGANLRPGRKRHGRAQGVPSRSVPGRDRRRRGAAADLPGGDRSAADPGPVPGCRGGQDRGAAVARPLRRRSTAAAEAIPHCL